jgi:hypothetical protein
MTWPDHSPLLWSRMSPCCLPCDLMKIEKSQGICRLPAVCSVIVAMEANRPTYPTLASQNASIASDLGTWQTASCIMGVGLHLQELPEEESPGSICSYHNFSLEYVKSQHLASYRHWSYDKQVLEYRKSQFAATVIFSQKNASQNTRHLANCLLRPSAALCNRTYSRTCLRHQVYECQTKLYVTMQWLRCLWFSLRWYRLLQGCHMMSRGARVIAATR